MLTPGQKCYITVVSLSAEDQLKTPASASVIFCLQSICSFGLIQIFNLQLGIVHSQEMQIWVSRYLKNFISVGDEENGAMSSSTYQVSNQIGDAMSEFVGKMEATGNWNT